MNVLELFEGKVTSAWRKKFKARIVLQSRAYDLKIKGYKDDENWPSQDAIMDAKAKAKVIFDKAVEEHPDGLCFATVDEAAAHMKNMEYPNWPMELEGANRWLSKKRNDPITIDYKDATLDDIQIEKLENGRHLVSIKAKSGPSLSAFLSVFHRLYEKKRWSKDGKKELSYGWRGNAFQTNATEKQIKAEIGSTKEIQDEEKEYKALKATPEFKKEKNKSDYAHRKEKLAREKLTKATYLHYKEVTENIREKIWKREEDAPVLQYHTTKYFSADITLRFEFPYERHSPVAAMSDDPTVAARLKSIQDKKYGNRPELLKKFKEELEKVDGFEKFEVDKHRVEISFHALKN